MNELAYLEIDEEITSVIDRLRKSKSSAVALVIPRGSTIAQSIVNLKLIKKSAEQFGRTISLVTNDRIAQNLASQVGVKVYSKTSEAQKDLPIEETTTEQEQPNEKPNGFKVNSYYNKNENNKTEADEDPRAETESTEEEPTTQPDEEEPVEEENPEAPYKTFERKEVVKADRDMPVRSLKRDKSKKIAFTIIGVVIVILLAISYVFIPYANASIVLKTDSLSYSKEVLVDVSAKEINKEDLVIPGQLVSIEKEATKTYQSTGKKEVGEKASGKITVYNEWDDKSQSIPEGSRFVSAGKAFISKSAVTVPGLTVSILPGKITANPGTVDVEVVAEAAGDAYNLGPSTFTISSLPTERQGKIYGRSAVAMSGGTTKTLGVVTDKDLKDASIDLQKNIVDSSKAELVSTALASQSIIFDSNVSSEVIAESANKKIDDESENFDYKIKVKLYSLSFTEKSLKTIITDSAKESLAENKMLVNPEKGEITYEMLSAKNQESLKIACLFKGEVGQKIESNEIRDEITGKKYNVAKGIIESKPMVDKVTLNIWPSPLFKVPFLKNRVKVQFDYAK